MKAPMTKWAVVATMTVLIGVLTAFTVNSDWDVPEEYAKMENPVKADDNSLDIGKELYMLHCKSCHGKYGEGDGPKAANLDTECGDFTMEEFQEQSDGSLFYKTKFGRDEMPTFEKKIPVDEDIWHIVNFMRELGE
jgi:mono/diheme cytochrome c family protein